MKKAIVIGATSGIGRSLASLLIAEKYRVGITGRRKEKLEAMLEESPTCYVAQEFDCTTARNAEELTELVDALGGLDLLVMSAGVGDLNEDLSYEIEQGTIDLNVTAFTEIVGWAYRFFEEQGYGHLAAISSVAGIRGNHVAPAYNASKAYQINYLEGLRQKAKKSGKPIYITDIRPGFVATAMAKGDGQFWVASPVKAARQIMRLLKRKKDFGYVTKRWRLVATLLKVVPNQIYKNL